MDRWLYQHNWIVTGAGFGWSSGAAALRTLIAVDQRIQRLWGVGAQSEKIARLTLAEVEARSGWSACPIPRLLREQRGYSLALRTPRSR